MSCCPNRRDTHPDQAWPTELGGEACLGFGEIAAALWAIIRHRQSKSMQLWPIHLATIGVIVHCRSLSSRNLPSCVSGENTNRQFYNTCFRTEQDGCQPGMYLPNPCGDCVTCPEQTFTLNWNNCSLCLTCQHCEHGVKEPCNAEKDAVCNDPPISSTYAEAAAPVSKELRPDPGAHRTSTEETRGDPSPSIISSRPPGERSTTTPDFTQTSTRDARNPKLDTTSEDGPSHGKPDVQTFIIAVLTIIILLLVVIIFCQNKRREDRARKQLNGAQPDDQDDPPVVGDGIDTEAGEIHHAPPNVEMQIEDEVVGGVVAGTKRVPADRESVAYGTASAPEGVGGGAATETEGGAGGAATGTEGVGGGAATGTEGVGGGAATGTEGGAGSAAAGSEGVAGGAAAGSEGGAGGAAAGSEGVAGGAVVGSKGSAGPAGGGALGPHLRSKPGKQIVTALIHSRTNGHITGCTHIDTDEPYETDSLLTSSV